MIEKDPLLKPSSTKPSRLDQLTLDLEPRVEAPVMAVEKPPIPSVSQLTRRIRGHLENSFFDVWVRGEISNFKKPVSGHAYFCLKDATAQLKAVMFKPCVSKIKFQIQDGMEVNLHGKVTVYEARGEYQMVCDTLEPVGTGALQLAFEQLKAKLQNEGLFESRHKKPLPYLPCRIGIITSATGAAVRDILKVLHRRYPHRHIYVLPASVQGEKAASEIVQAIELAERWNSAEPNKKIEVLIVGRGGGALEDLWPFNEEAVARAIFACSIPVISAVGHEIDFTIADFVADVRAPTPSAAAEIVLPKMEDLVYQLSTQQRRLNILIQRRLEQFRLHLGHLTQRLVDPRQKIKNTRDTLNFLNEKMTVALHNRVLLAKKRLEAAAILLNSLSPLRVIARGYSITLTSDQQVVKTVKSLKKGQRLTTKIADGTLESELIEIT